MIKDGMKERMYNLHTKEMTSLLMRQMDKTYHIYFEDRLIFKGLDEEEFEWIWEKLNKDYNREELNYSEMVDNPTDEVIEHSY